MTILDEQLRQLSPIKIPAVNVVPAEPLIWPELYPWPILSPNAMYGLAGEIVRSVESETEADPVALLATLLVAFGNAVGPGAHAKVHEVQMIASTATTGDELEATFAHEGSHGSDYAQGIFWDLSKQTVPNSMSAKGQEPNNMEEAHAYIQTQQILSEAFGKQEAGHLMQETLPFWSGQQLPQWSIQEISHAYCIANNPGC